MLMQSSISISPQAFDDYYTYMHRLHRLITVYLMATSQEGDLLIESEG